MAGPLLGVLADDFTGATDAAMAFRRAGLRTAIHFGSPQPGWSVIDADAVVVALKTRTIAPADAVRSTRAAARQLVSIGADQIYFKYCSTFDSRPDGNIGPVLDDLTELLDAQQVVVCPASPEHHRTVYQGHLFVGAELLSESPMRHHPLTPMRDSSIQRLLAPQTRHPVDLIGYDEVRSGAEAIAGAFARLATDGARYAVVDAITDDDLTALATAAAGHPLISGAAGLAEGLGRFRAARLHRAHTSTAPIGHPRTARSAVLAGSCSARTLEQVEAMRAVHPSHFLDAAATPDSDVLAAAAFAFVDTLTPGQTPLIYSTLPPEVLRETQEILGRDAAAQILERAMGIIARGLADRGFDHLIVAGGETSGAVVSALEIGLAAIGEQVAPGLCWVHPTDRPALALLLKSGNFGSPNLLVDTVAQPTGALA